MVRSLVRLEAGLLCDLSANLGKSQSMVYHASFPKNATHYRCMGDSPWLFIALGSTDVLRLTNRVMMLGSTDAVNLLLSLWSLQS